MKADVERRIRDHKEKVTIELSGGSKVSGRLTQAGADDFAFTANNPPRTIAYSEVIRIKGKGWSTGKKIGIIAAIGGAVTTVILLVVFHEITQNN